MGMQGEAAIESMTQFLCKKLEEKIEKYPEATKALKEVGTEILNDLPNIPEWTGKYYQLFRE
jgi:hypothetical protein